MSDLIVLGSDTDAGKTTFALVWLAALGERWAYWKPIESGTPDSERVRELVPRVYIHPAAARFRDAVAPGLAARREGRVVPCAARIAAARPACTPGAHLLIETFGGPFSPLDDTELQITLIRLLAAPAVLVTPSTVGAIGRTLQCLAALASHAMRPVAAVLVGPPDPYAAARIAMQAPETPVFLLEPPRHYDAPSIASAAAAQHPTIEALLAIATHAAASAPQPHAARARGDAAPPLPSESAGGTRHTSRSTEAASWAERDRVSVWHPYTSLEDPEPPQVVVSAQDEFLTLEDGRRVIDAISSWWTILHGHRHPVLMRALAQASERYDHVQFAGLTHRPGVELAEAMLATMPWRGGLVFYSDDGSTAVEVALKMAYQYWCHRGEPERTQFVAFDGAYHGDTFGAMAVGRDPVFFGRFEPLLFQARRLPVSPERLEDALRAHRGQVAAVILEPLVQGAGGMRMHTPDTLRAIHEVTRRHGVLFIADEVMTGGGRTGELWAHRSAGIAPDLVCAGKTIAGGVLPLAATLASPDVVAAWRTSDPTRTFFHGHSFTAHPLACAVGVANWRLLASGLRETTGAIERFWMDRLAPLCDRPGIRDVRVRGTIAAIELDAAGGYLAGVGRHVRRLGLEHGVLLRPLGSVLYAMPPLGVSLASLECIADAMTQAVAAVSRPS